MVVLVKRGITMRKSILKLDMIVLQMLSKADSYGYEISSNISDATNGVIDIKEGVLYPILYKLVEDGSITSYDKVVNRRNRVYYTLTKSGNTTLQYMIKEYKELTQAVNILIDEDMQIEKG